MRALLFAAMIAVPLLASSTSASAEQRDKKPLKVAVIAVEISGDGAPELRQVMQGHIKSGLRSTGARVIGLEQTLRHLKSKPELIGCTSSACLERIEEITSSKQFVRARITANGTNYDLQLQLFDSKTEGGALRTIDESCDVCTVSELGELLAKSSKKLLLPEEAQLYSVRISTNPSGARITIDGTNAGSSPVDTTLSVGLHSVSASLGGLRDAQSNIVVKSTSDLQPFALALSPNVIVQPVPDKGAVDYGLWKWGAALGSGGLLVLGGVLISRDGDVESMGRRTGEKQNSLAGGIASVSGGLLLGAVAGWMFWREHKSPQTANSLSLKLSADGAIGAYQLQF